MAETQVLFVCTANICRSPTAEAVMRKYVQEAGLHGRVFVDSAGTHDFHIGAPPDPRAQAAARRRGYDLTALRARQVTPEDFEKFDLVLGMDFNNLAALHDISPTQYRHKIGLLMPYAKRRRASIIHDPYARSTKDFDLVLDYIEDACSGLVETLSRNELSHGAEMSAYK
ncbi:MAG TPA: low molecular weight protein-tyrosine-phosphatase [Noviherbaspirillum sp.]|nr:low molecular weight protein-tyrosine-phosphatase [Noviherbaspirillum sp.]